MFEVNYATDVAVTVAIVAVVAVKLRFICIDI